jgi:L-fuculose-phosphate aldolase
LKHELRGALIAAAVEMNRSGLNRGTSGNLSVRAGDHFLITPTGMPYESLMASDVCELAIADGRAHGSRRIPSSEWRMHMVTYQRRPEIGALVHAHSMFATTLSINQLDIPPRCTT